MLPSTTISPWRRPPVLGARRPAPGRPSRARLAVSAAASGAELKTKLLRKAALTKQGAGASQAERAEIEEIVRDIVAVGEVSLKAFGDLGGRWQLLYSSTPAWRTSPFFWALQDAAGEAPLGFFQALQLIPGASVGKVLQDIDVESGNFISEVDVALWPNINGTVVTSSIINRAEGADSSRGDAVAFDVSVNNTQLRPGEGAPRQLEELLAGVRVPVESLLRTYKQGELEVSMRCLYVDDDIRVTEAPTGLFVFARLV